MRGNKIHNCDLFTSAANQRYNKHIKTHSKKALEMIKSMIDWDRLISPIEKKLSELKEDKSPAGRKGFDLIVILKCFIL